MKLAYEFQLFLARHPRPDRALIIYFKVFYYSLVP